MLTSALLGLAIMSLGIAVILLEKRVRSLQEEVIDYKVDNLMKVAKEVNLGFSKIFDKVKKKSTRQK